MINICFHGIGTPQRTLEPGEDRYWITRELYEQIVAEVRGRSDVELSFDDGNASDFEFGLQPLLASGRKATFFVLAARLDQPGSLSRTQVVDLQRQGMRIESHGMDHIPWRGLTPQQQDREFTQARAIIAETSGKPVRQAALPLGRYDRSVLRSLRRLGYERVYTSDRDHTSAKRWLQPRYSVHTEDTIESVRSHILQPPPLPTRIKLAAKTLVKRLR